MDGQRNKMYSQKHRHADRQNGDRWMGEERNEMYSQTDRPVNLDRNTDKVWRLLYLQRHKQKYSQTHTHTQTERQTERETRRCIIKQTVRQTNLDRKTDESRR